MSIILNANSVALLADLVEKKGEIKFFESLPDFEELQYGSRKTVIWTTSHGRIQQLISIEYCPDSIEIISKDVEGGDIWSLVLPRDVDDDRYYSKSRLTLLDVIHDFTNSSEEYSSSSDDYEEDEYAEEYDGFKNPTSPQEIADAIAERYGVSQEDDE